MKKPTALLFTSIGSAGLAILGGLGVLISPFVIALTSWAGALLRGLAPVVAGRAGQAAGPPLVFIGRLAGGAGLIVGILLLLFSGLQLVLGILAWKRRDDPARAGFGLAVGIAFAIASLALGLTAPGLLQLALSVLLILGAALSREQATGLAPTDHAREDAVS